MYQFDGALPEAVPRRPLEGSTWTITILGKVPARGLEPLDNVVRPSDLAKLPNPTFGLYDLVKRLKAAKCPNEQTKLHRQLA